jgi:predicted transcriptional regulator
MAAHPLTLDPDLQQRLEKVAVREVRSPEILLRDAVETYLRACGEMDEALAPSEGYAHDDESRQQFLKRTDASLEHYERTGLHVTWEEVDQWLGKLQAGEDAPPPECHV